MNGEDDDDTRARALLRRIARLFAIVVLTLPLTMLGGAWNVVLVLDIVAAALALRAAIELRRIMRSE